MIEAINICKLLSLYSTKLLEHHAKFIIIAKVNCNFLQHALDKVTAPDITDKDTICHHSTKKRGIIICFHRNV